jgi:hypothetical protein
MKHLIIIAIVLASASLVCAQTGGGSGTETGAGPGSGRDAGTGARPPSGMEGRSHDAGDAPIDQPRRGMDEGVPGMSNLGRQGAPGGPGTEPAPRTGNQAIPPDQPLR